MPVFQTPQPISANLELVLGDARVVASDRTTTNVVVRPVNAANADDVKAADQTRVEFADGRLTIKSQKTWRNSVMIRGGGSIEVVVELPAGSHLAANTAVGGLRTEGRLGDCRLYTSMGLVRVESAEAINAYSAYGDIAIEEAASAEVKAESGEIQLGRVGGNASVRNGNGTIRIGDVTGDLHVRAANGAIEIGRAAGSIEAKTANGDIRVAEVIRGSVSLATAMGELDVGIRRGTAAWLDLNSQYGNVRNALDSTGGPQATDATVEIRARTAFGDILIGRSPSHTHPL